MFEQLIPLLPEIYLAGVTLFALLVGIFSKPDQQFKNTFVISISGLVAVFALFIINVPSVGLESVFFIKDAGETESLFFTSGLASSAKLLITLCAIVIMMISKPYLASRQSQKFEFNILLLTATLGAYVALSTYNLIIMFIGLELLSFSLYVLVGFVRQSQNAMKSATKYFIVGSIASALMLYGISLVYLTSGSVSYIVMAEHIAQSTAGLSFEYTLAIILITMALFFKIAIAPLQFYLADVLQGCNRPTLGYISTVSKIVGLVVLYQFWAIILGDKSQNQDFYHVMFIFGLLSIFVGSIYALKEESINKFLAYSSINNAGFMLVCSTMLDFNTLMFYLVNYCLVILALVSFILSFKVRGEYIKKIQDLAFIAKQNHKFALLGVLLIFTLAGVPPFVMFYAKFAVIKGLVAQGFIVYAVLAVVFSIFAVAYCLRVIKFAYLSTKQEDVSIQTITSTKVLTYLLSLLIVIFSISPNIIASLF
ncbi:MAG TPA: hypothetical protein DCL21_06075 [Alphaproteobacteria bacterium]|nr:hypothetical protein [Alphaproteobacteria bacterium]